VPEILWYRRRTARPSLRRQRATLFQGGPPPYALLPWWLVHAGALGWMLGAHGAEGMDRATGLRLAAVHAWVIAAYAGRRRIVRIREAVVQGIVGAVVGFFALLRRLLAPIRA
jgi:hypothetical protein